MKPPPTDIDPLPHQYRNLVPLTGLTPAQIHTVATWTRQRLLPRTGRPWGLPLPVRMLLVLTHLRTDLTTRALAALFDLSQSTVDRITHHPVPLLAEVPKPDNSNESRACIIDGTLIPVHNQTITAISKNYRRSVNTQIIICAERRRVVALGRCWPGNRNDVVVARHIVAPLLDGNRLILGDGRYCGIDTITTPRPDSAGRIIRDNHYRAHRRIRSRVEHVIARLKGWQILPQCRRRGHAINYALRIIAGLWNLKTRNHLRVTS
jgi:hypothetical protein